MKGGDYIQHNNNDNDNREYGIVAPGQRVVQRNIQQLLNLGFEEDELEMFFDTYNVDNNEIIDKYLEVASMPPYNLSWNTIDDAENADYETTVLKPNGTTYTKHDIANDVLSYFSDNMQGGKKIMTKNKSKKRMTKNKSKKRMNKNKSKKRMNKNKSKKRMHA